MGWWALDQEGKVGSLVLSLALTDSEQGAETLKLVYSKYAWQEMSQLPDRIMVGLKDGTDMQKPLSVEEKAASGSLLESEGCRGQSWIQAGWRSN